MCAAGPPDGGAICCANADEAISARMIAIDLTAFFIVFFLLLIMMDSVDVMDIVVAACRSCPETNRRKLFAVLNANLDWFTVCLDCRQQLFEEFWFVDEGNRPCRKALFAQITRVFARHQEHFGFRKMLG